MSVVSRTGERVERLVARYFDGALPPTEGLPRYVAPLPEWVENVGLRLAWPIALVNLVGTIFGFWYYAGRRFSAPFIAGQFAGTPVVAWPVVPDSPVATMFIGLSLAAWKLGYDAEWLHVMAFFGCIKLGLWTPYVQYFVNGLGEVPLWLYHFLIWSHLAMAIEAFLIYRYSDFPVWAVALATTWYLFNDIVDYFLPLVGDFHHTLLRAELTASGYDHSLPAHEMAAAGAVFLPVLAVFLQFQHRPQFVRVVDIFDLRA